MKVMVEGFILFLQLLIIFAKVVPILVPVLTPHFHNPIRNLLIIIHFNRYLIIFESFKSMLLFFILESCFILKYEDVRGRVVMPLT